MSIALNTQNNNFNYKQEIQKVSEILTSKTISTQTKLAETSKSFFSLSSYAEKLNDQNTELKKELDLLIENSNKIREIIEKDRQHNNEIEKKIQQQFEEQNKILSDQLEKLKIDKENFYSENSNLEIKNKNFEIKRQFEDKAEKLLSDKYKIKNLSNLGCDALNIIGSCFMISIVGFPLFMAGSIGYDYFQQKETDLEGYIWALKNFPEACEDEEILSRAKMIGIRHHINKIRKELIFSGLYKGSLTQPWKSMYVEQKMNMTIMKMHSLSRQELEEIEEKENSYIANQEEELKHIIKNKFYINN